MNKTILSLLLGCVSLLSAHAEEPDVIIPDSTGFKFTDTRIVPTTPVKDQHKSGTCWCYSTNTFFESEILRKTGKEIHLSEGFVVHHCYLDKAEKYVRMDGKVNFAEGGAAGDVSYVWRKYGMVPNEVYTGMTYGDEKFETSELTAALEGYVSVINQNKRKKLTPAWKDGLNGILDAYMGKLPESFTYEGKSYTPKSYAASLPINLDDYISICSFTHHPFLSAVYPRGCRQLDVGKLSKRSHRRVDGNRQQRHRQGLLHRLGCRRERTGLQVAQGLRNPAGGAHRRGHGW